MTEAQSGPLVRTGSGYVRGRSAEGVVTFFGIPYAAPPVGPLRFQPPAKHEPWPGERDADDRGPSAPQRLRAFPALDISPLVDGGGRRGDDYLTLNVWAPPGAEAAPVLVFIHGGAFQIGSKDAAVHDGSGFARSGVVSIAINYRVGIDGFLPIKGASTNIALRDMIAALEWIRENVAAFGGDPENVTVCGESSGAMAIGALVASPLCEGLFRRAIMMSGHGGMVRPLYVAARVIDKLARRLGVALDVAGFGSKSIDEVLTAVETLAKPGKVNLRDEHGLDPVFGMSLFVPVHGDDVLPQHPLEALEAGAGRNVEVLIGSCSEEMNLYFVPTGVSRRMFGLLARWLVGRSMPNALGVLRAYGLGRRRAGAVATEALTDLVFRWPTRQFAAAHQGRSHVYEMDWRSPACEGLLGACHGIDLPFAFDTLACVTGPAGLAGIAPPQDLATRVHGLWVDFATDGQLPWPSFEAETRQVYRLADAAANYEPIPPAAEFLRDRRIPAP